MYFLVLERKKSAQNPLSGSSAAAAMLTNITETVNSYLTRVSTLDGSVNIVVVAVARLPHFLYHETIIGFYLFYFPT